MVFHCALSQQRGPGAARRYLAERGKRMKDEEVEKGKEGEKEEEGKRKEQVVWVLEGGFVRWQERYVRPFFCGGLVDLRLEVLIRF